MEELELTYLAVYLPADLNKSEKKEIVDIYWPASFDHPKIRLRKNGDVFELTKKEPIIGLDSSRQLEQTINLTEEEYVELSKLSGKRLRKIRHYYSYNGRIAEFDVFQDELYGLVVIDFEFTSEEEKKVFRAPDFCLSDVTQDKFMAGGVLAGKKYEDLEKELNKRGYKKLIY